jgi:hypothetical protein
MISGQGALVVATGKEVVHRPQESSIEDSWAMVAVAGSHE